MLSKIECRTAIAAWDEARRDYKHITKLVRPEFVFTINEKQRYWVKQYNDGAQFHTYMGVHKDQAILIIVPLDANGREVKLDEYETSPLQKMEKELKIEEVNRYVEKKITKLSPELQKISSREVVESSVKNAPDMTEKTALKEIEAWRDNCLDWFYHECTDYKGERVFQAFEVPIEDLDLHSRRVEESVCLFGLKESLVYKRLIPVLIFVGVKGEKAEETLMRDGEQTDGDKENPTNFSRPNPPFGRDGEDFGLING